MIRPLERDGTHLREDNTRRSIGLMVVRKHRAKLQIEVVSDVLSKGDQGCLAVSLDAGLSKSMRWDPPLALL